MKLKKTVAIVAAAGALAAISVPAMAFENEFHGMLREKAILSNFDNFGAGQAVPLKNAKDNFYIEQRARLLYNAKASDDLKAVIQLEIDSRWGDQAYGANSISGTSFTGRNSGGGLESDRVNLETKNVYLDFKIPGTPVRTKAGIQGFTDEYKGIFLGYADTAGLTAAGKFGGVDVTAGWLRFWDINEGSQTLRQTAVNTYVLGGKLAVSKDLKVGLNYYLLTDGTANAYPSTSVNNQNTVAAALGLAAYDDIWLHMVGATAEAKIGPVSIDGFVVGQFGTIGKAQVTGGTAKDLDVTSFAANARAKVKAGPGTARVEAIYVSGDGLGGGDKYNGFITGSQYNLAASFYVSPEMMILLPNKNDINSSRSLVYDVNNRSQGLIGGFLGYDATLTDKVYASANAGFMAVAKSNRLAQAGTAKSNYLGTEINAELGYKLYSNLTASLQGAYVILGDYYKGTGTDANGNAANPDNPYTSRVMLSYAF